MEQGTGTQQAAGDRLLSDTHSHICLRVEHPLSPCQYKTTSESFSQVLIEFGIKEELRQLWKQSSKKQAERFLESWCSRAESSGIKMLQQFAKTVRKARTGLLNWYDYPISTGPLEGTNNKNKTM
ncbi:MAG: transposase [Planctomycetaceae bacterium]|nr:transposase [Planctomycetaceae bacterium]